MPLSPKQVYPLSPMHGWLADYCTVLRDVKERGRDVEGCVKQWFAFVKPNFEKVCLIFDLDFSLAKYLPVRRAATESRRYHCASWY